MSTQAQNLSSVMSCIRRLIQFSPLDASLQHIKNRRNMARSTNIKPQGEDLNHTVGADPLSWSAILETCWHRSVAEIKMCRVQNTFQSVQASDLMAYSFIICGFLFNAVDGQWNNSAFCLSELYPEPSGASDGDWLLHQQCQHDRTHSNWLWLWDGLHGASDCCLPRFYSLKTHSSE